jgi:hypothetical protein
MEHFIRVVMEKQDNLNESLNESVFPGSIIYESAQGVSIFEMPLPTALSEEAANEFAQKIANYVFEQGYDDFDIEISADGDVAEDEETYEDDDDFYEDYGVMWYNEDDDPIDEAEYQGRKVKLGKPMQGDVKKFKVYVKDPKTGNVKKVNFGHGGSSVKGKSMKIRKNNPAARRSFRARHNCDNPGPRTKARYWSCRKW